MIKFKQCKIKGFLSIKEAQKLQELFQNVYHLGAVVEIGILWKISNKFCWIAEKVGGIIYTIDHHSGSEEHQLGKNIMMRTCMMKAN